MAHLQTNRYLLVANGRPPENLFQTIAGFQGKVIALDGAVNLFQSSALFPQVILGDFDSVTDKAFWGIKDGSCDESYVGEKKINILARFSQEQTDLEKGISYCLENAASEIHITNVVGERLDHFFSAVSLLKKYANETCSIYLHGEKQTVFFARNSTQSVSGNVGEHCGFFGMPVACIHRTSGLVWEINETLYPKGLKLKFGEKDAGCNILKTNTATINFEGDLLIVAPFTKPI